VTGGDGIDFHEFGKVTYERQPIFILTWGH